MNDAEYLFNTTSYDRKRIARGSYSKVNGSKSKKCSLPSDSLTPSQLKKRSGKVMSYNLGKPMYWDEFKKMPKDLQSQYIQKLSDMGACVADVARMFETSSGNFQQYMFNNHKGERHFPLHKRDNSAFWNWVNEGDWTDETKGEREEVMQEVAELEKLQRIPLEIQSGWVSMYGDPRAIFEKVLLSLDTSKSYNITVSFKAVEE